MFNKIHQGKKQISIQSQKKSKTIHKNLQEIKNAKNYAKEDDLIIVGGSTFVVAEVL